MEESYYAISLDEWGDASFEWLGENQDGGAGHYARFTGTKAECVEKTLKALRPLVEKMLYVSDDYGYPLHTAKAVAPIS